MDASACRSTHVNRQTVKLTPTSSPKLVGRYTSSPVENNQTARISLQVCITMSNSRLQSQKAIRGANRLALPQAAGSEVSRTALPPFGEGVFRSGRRGLQADFFENSQNKCKALLLHYFLSRFLGGHATCRDHKSNLSQNHDTDMTVKRRIRAS